MLRADYHGLKCEITNHTVINLTNHGPAEVISAKFLRRGKIFLDSYTTLYSVGQLCERLLGGTLGLSEAVIIDQDFYFI